MVRAKASVMFCAPFAMRETEAALISQRSASAAAVSLVSAR